MQRRRLLFLTALLVPVLAAQASTRYVDANLASGANNGTSWADAYQGATGLVAAVGASIAGDQIWVADGNYKPTLTATRSIYFTLKNGVEIYGGFAGGETLLSQRDVALNVAVLNADLSGNDGSSIFTDNSFHVIDATGTNATAVLDGFTVRGGNANTGGGNQDRGGGILCINSASPTVRNCAFLANRCTFGGGAGYIFNSAAPTFIDTRFEGNVGGSFGGAFDMNAGPATFLRCQFIANTAARAGGIECFSGSNAKVTNCVFRDNTATGSGGGGAIWISGSTPVIRDCTIVGNNATANAAGGILGAAAIANCIVYFNEGPGGVQGLANNISGASATYSCIQGGLAGTGNISVDPSFVNLAGNDLHLSGGSPCADAGNNAAVPVGTTTDLDGLPRFADAPAVGDTGSGTSPLVDMGAYEVQNTLYTLFCAGDGSLATACPCGNNSPVPGNGCVNSELFSVGAVLGASGSASPDTVVLSASQMLPTVTCVYLQGNAEVVGGLVFGDGVRCVGGTLKRLFIKVASGGASSAPDTGAGDPSISARSASLGDTIGVGELRYYQVYYRDPDLAFCAPPAGNSWNVTSGAIVQW